MYKMNYTIEIATVNESPEIMQFIDTHWKKNHILGVDRLIFDYQYKNIRDPRFLNMVVARNLAGNIVGIFGFIPCEPDKIDCDIFGSIWKVIDENKHPLLGLRLIQFMKKRIKGSFVTLGNNEISTAIFKHMKFDSGQLIHWYLGNEYSRRKNIASNLNIVDHKILSNDYSLRKLKMDAHVFNDLDLTSCSPGKNFSYLQHRFIEHPVYEYEFWGIFSQTDLKACLITREQRCNDSKCIRGVDFYGHDQFLYGCTGDLYRMLINRDVEYLDLYAFGLDPSKMLGRGFSYPTGDVVVPNYFEPFEKNNIPIRFAFKTNGPVDVRIFKADGDQDRPNNVEASNV